MRWHLIVGAGLLVAAPLFAGDSPSPADLAKKIDARLNERIKANGVTAAPRLI